MSVRSLKWRTASSEGYSVGRYYEEQRAALQALDLVGMTESTPSVTTQQQQAATVSVAAAVTDAQVLQVRPFFGVAYCNAERVHQDSVTRVCHMHSQLASMHLQ